MLEILLNSFLVGVVFTGLGGIIGIFFSFDNTKSRGLLLSFASGIMLSITFFDLMVESLHLSDAIFTSFYVLLGLVFIYVCSNIIDHAPLLAKYRTNQGNAIKISLFKSGIMLVFAIGLHNFPEGIAIGSSYGYEVKMGILLMVMIAFHNIPEGMAVVTFLLASGMKKSKAVYYTALSGAPTILGALLGYYLGQGSAYQVALSLSLASGAMLYVVFFEMIPQSQFESNHHGVSFMMILGILLAFLTIYLA